VDPEAAARIAPRDLVRISRALEVYEQTGVTISSLRRQAAPPGDLAPVTLVLDPPLGELRRRIQGRLRRMLAGGLVEEVRALRAAGYGPSLRSMQALGYKQIGAFVDGAATLEDAVAQTVAATAAYARRQRTWFRKEQAAARLSAEPRLEDLDGAVAELGLR
jgi:tRNA dimethylallyltransferase